MRTTLRNAVIAAGLGAATATLVAPLLSAIILPVSAQNAAQDAPGAVGIDNFTFNPQKLTVKAGTTVTWTNKDDIPHAIAAVNKQFKSKALDTGDAYSFTFTTPGSLRVFLLAASTHDRHDRGRSGDRKQRRAVMLDRTRQPALAASWTAERESMSADGDAERARRFREAALPHLDDVYTLSRYLMRDAADAEDAVQECYLRALRHFDSYRGPAMKPWLLAILRNVCKVEFARRTSQPTPAEPKEDEQAADELQPWQEPQLSPEAQLLRRCDGETIRRLVAALPEPFREAVVLRDINDLSYRDIAEVVGVPVGTVMSRLARARSMLRARWNVEEGSAT